MINLDDRILADLTEKELWLLIHLARRIKADRVCWPSNNRILEDTRWKDARTLSAAKKSLIEKGLLRQSTRTRDDGSQASNEYTILTNMIAVWMGANTLQETVAQNAPTPPHEMYPPPVQNMQGGEGHKMHPLEVLTSEVLTSEEENVVFDENDAPYLVTVVGIERPISEPGEQAAPKKKKKEGPPPPGGVVEVIDYLNSVMDSTFRPTTKTTITAIRGILELGYTVADIKAVIDFKAAKWKGDEKMDEYIRPKTLFAKSNFEDYSQAMRRNKHTNSTESTDPAHTKFLQYIEAQHPALWRSSCRVFSLEEYTDYMTNATLPGLSNVLTAEERRTHLARIMARLNGSENERKRTASLFAAYVEAMRNLLTGKSRAA